MLLLLLGIQSPLTASLVISQRAGQNLAKIADILPVLAVAGWSTDLALKEYGAQTMDLAARAAAAGTNLVIAYGVSSAVVPALQEGKIIVVEGKKSKRGVIWAKQVVI